MTLAALLLTFTATGAPGLTLEHAIQRARDNHEDPQIARARISRARALHRVAVGALLPRIAGTAAYTRRAREVVRTIEGRDAVIQRKDAFSGVATAELSLLDPSAIAGIGAASSGVDAAELDLEHVEQVLAFEVAEAFFTALSTEQLARAAERRAELAQSIVADAAARLEAGMGQRNDLTRAELELSTAVLEQTRAANGHDTARLVLERLMGERVPETLIEPASITFAPDAGAEALVERALERHPQLLAQRLRAEAASRDARAELFRALPQVGVAGRYEHTSETGFAGEPWDWNVTLALTWTLYDGGVRYGLAAAARAEAAEAELVGEGLRRDLQQQIRKALLDRDTARIALAQARARVAFAEQNVEEARLRFSRGLTTSLDVTNSVVEEFEARADLARQTYAVSSSELALAQAVGAFPGDRDS